MTSRSDPDQLSQSMKVLNIQDIRPDIQQATDGVSSIKAKLVYRNGDELDTGLQKVQPLPFLDEEIKKYHEQIRESVEGAKSFNDNVPNEILQRVDRATKLAHNGETGLFKASELLEFTFDAYQYARLATQDQFDLKRECSRHIRRFEEAFRKMVDLRIKADDLQEADRELEQCLSHMESAVREAHRDVADHQKRADNEDALVQETALHGSHDEVRGMVKQERSELNLIGVQCVRDIKTIDDNLSVLRKSMQGAKRDYEHSDSQRRKTLEENRREQRQLEERLRRLKEEERQLVRDGEVGLQLQESADKAFASTEKEVLEWKEKISGLRGRTDTSLSVMGCMEECTDLIMEDAKEKKAQWKRKLNSLALESLWALRETLLIKGATTMMVLEDNRSNAKDCEDLIMKNEREKKSAAQKNFQMRVQSLKKEIEEYREAKESHDCKVRESEEQIKSISTELLGLNQKISELQPGLKLDSLDERYQEQKQRKDQAFSAESTAGLSFLLFHPLPRSLTPFIPHP